MTVLKSFSDLVDAALSVELNDNKAKEEWRRLYQTYESAINNPPLGVIGVGAITYAENALIQAQTLGNKDAMQ